MTKNKFTAEQVVRILQEAEAGEKSETDICRERASRRTRSMRGRGATAGWKPRRLEGSRSSSVRTRVSRSCWRSEISSGRAQGVGLKRLLGAPAKRAGARHMMARGLSQRMACELLGLGRSSLAYRAAPSRNAELTARLHELASAEPRLGYRMAWARLRTEFAPLNLKRVRRIWREEGLHLRPRKSRRIRGAVKPDLIARYLGHIWCLTSATTPTRVVRTSSVWP